MELKTTHKTEINIKELAYSLADADAQDWCDLFREMGNAIESKKTNKISEIAKAFAHPVGRGCLNFLYKLEAECRYQHMKEDKGENTEEVDEEEDDDE